MNETTQQARPSILKFLWPYLHPYRYKAFGAFAFSFFLAAIKFAEAYLVKPIFDHGLSAKSQFSEALALAGVLFLLGLLNFPFRFFHFYWIRYVVDRCTCDVREELFSKLQKLPTAYYNKSKQGTLISGLLNDTQTFSSGFKASVDLIREPLTAIFMFGLALYRDVQLTMVIVVVAPLFILIFGKSGKKVRSHQSEVQEEMAHMTHALSEGISGHKITKAFNLQRYVMGRFLKTQQGFFDAQMRTTWVEEMAHPLVELVGAVAFCGVIVFAHHRISSGAMSTGDFVSFITALALLMDPIRKYSQANVKLNQAMASAERIFRILEIPEENDPGTVELVSFKDGITIKNLSFSYGENDVVRDISLKIKKGQKVAFVGLSGSGKSTLINLLLGLYPIERGEIMIDGVSVKDLKLSSLRGLFGLVSQDIFLFHDTILENLKIGKHVSDAEIHKALEVSYADQFVNLLTLKEQTVIGDRGTRLSGGQQQRLTIARAFLQNPEILLFDEATSALDNESEKVVQKALENLSGDKTVIAVAHRLSTIQEYDQIFVMKEGHLIESGNHHELMGKGGEYAKLYALSLKA